MTSTTHYPTKIPLLAYNTQMEEKAENPVSFQNVEVKNGHVKSRLWQTSITRDWMRCCTKKLKPKPHQSKPSFDRKDRTQQRARQRMQRSPTQQFEENIDRKDDEFHRAIQSAGWMFEQRAASIHRCERMNGSRFETGNLSAQLG